MRRGWILFLLAAASPAQEFSEDELDRTIRGVGRGELAAVRKIATWGPRAARAATILIQEWSVPTPGFQDAVDAALRAIGPLAIPELARALKEGGPTGRGRAAALLEEAARRAKTLPVPVEEFFPYVRDGDPEVRVAMVALLARRGAEGEKPLFELLDDPDRTTRLWVAMALTSQGPALVPRLLPLLSQKSPRRREAAAHALAWIDGLPEEAFPLLIAAAGDADKGVRAEAVFALAQSGPEREETRRCLLGALADPADAVVASAIFGVVRGGPAAVPHLIAAWDGDDRAARHATECLVWIGDPASEPVAEAFRSGSPRRKLSAATCLGRMAAERDRPVDAVLVPALADADAEVRLAAADALGIVTPQVSARAIDALLAAVRDPAPRVRAAAIVAAARAAPSDPRLADALLTARNEAEPAVKLAVAAENAASPEEWARCLKGPATPVAGRLLSAERIRGMRAPGGAVLEPLAQVVADRAQLPEVRVAAANAIGAIAVRRLFEPRFEPRVDATTRPSRAAARRGLGWLAAAQQGDGRWRCDGFDHENHDMGVTGLALLAFLAAGETDRAPAAHAKDVRDGFAWMLSRQNAEGLFQEGAGHDHTLLEHAIATHALCELVGMTGDDTLRAQAQKAVDACAASRSTLGWKYVARGPDSDTNVTTWMVVALRVAEEVGCSVDPNAYKGARRWIGLMTEPNFGGVGYNYPGGAPARPVGREDKYPPDKSRSTTACGILCRILMGEDPKAVEEIRKGADLCLELPPRWGPNQGFIDMYFWYYSSLALFQVGGAHWKKWNDVTAEAIVGHQKEEETPGSWDPLCVWGWEGGRVYSTAMCTLTLLTPWRYPRGWSLETKPPAAYVAAEAALAEAAESPYERLRAAAKQALERCPGAR